MNVLPNCCSLRGLGRFPSPNTFGGILQSSGIRDYYLELFYDAGHLGGCDGGGGRGTSYRPELEVCRGKDRGECRICTSREVQDWGTNQVYGLPTDTEGLEKRSITWKETGQGRREWTFHTVWTRSPSHTGCRRRGPETRGSTEVIP